MEIACACRMSSIPLISLPSQPVALATTLRARVLRRDSQLGMVTLLFEGGELRVPMIEAPVDSGVSVTIAER